MHKGSTRRTFVKSSAAIGAGLAAGLPASKAILAQEATPAAEEAQPGMPPLPEGALIVADGLWNPRGIAVADDGTLYITEQGVGGDEEVAMPAPPAASPVAADVDPAAAAATPVAEETSEEPPPTRGYTGQITQVTPDGQQSVVAPRLASYSTGVGPHGITVLNGEVFFTIGGQGVGMGVEPLPEENTVNRVDVAAGTVEQVASLGQYEVDNNPDGTDVNPNLYGIDGAPDGRLYVADAGGNTIYAVDPATGDFELLGIVPDPAEGRQSVPTGIVAADNGTFISLLSEGLPEGSSSIVTLSADGTFTPSGGTLFGAVNLGIGPDGQLYAVEMFGPSDDPNMPGPGRVVRVYADGTVEPVVENLVLPHGINFDVAGNMYLTLFSAFMSTPASPAGIVIRLDGIAAPA